MESALAPLGDQLSCEPCRQALQTRLNTLIMQWSAVKVIVLLEYILLFTYSVLFRERFSPAGCSLASAKVANPLHFSPLLSIPQQEINAVELFPRSIVVNVSFLLPTKCITGISLPSFPGRHTHALDAVIQPLYLLDIF